MCPLSKVEVIPRKWAYGKLHNRNRQPESVRISEGSKCGADSDEKKTSGDVRVRREDIVRYAERFRMSKL